MILLLLPEMKYSGIENWIICTIVSALYQWQKTIISSIIDTFHRLVIPFWELLLNSEQIYRRYMIWRQLRTSKERRCLFLNDLKNCEFKLIFLYIVDILLALYILVDISSFNIGVSIVYVCPFIKDYVWQNWWWRHLYNNKYMSQHIPGS